MSKELTGYDLSRAWFDFSFENPDLINTNHSALLFFAIEQCNRLGWKQKFGLPTTMAKDAIGIRSYNTYINTLNDLIDWGFIKLIEKSKNQYSSNIIALSKNTKATTKALDKALIKHGTKQSESTIQSIDSIDKQRTINKEQLTSIGTHTKNDFEINYTEYPDKVVKGWPVFETWLNENAPRVQKLSKPITINSYSKHFDKYESEKGRQKLLAMHNRKNLDYIDANLAFLSWYDYDKNGKTGTTQAGNLHSGGRKDFKGN